MSEPVYKLLLVALVLGGGALLVYFFFRGMRGSARGVVNTVTETIPRNLVGAGEEAGNAVLRLTKNAADTVKDIFKLRPEITSERIVTFGHSKEVLELAVLSKQITIEHEVREKWLGMPKTVSAVARYEVKIGYDLTETFQMKVLGEVTPTELEMILPTPRILSVEEQGEVEFKENDKPWNRITKEDRERLRMELKPLVRSKAMEMELLDQADQKMKDRLEASLREVLPPQLPITFLHPPDAAPGWQIKDV